ncbi:hypothetical protein [Halomonas urumqiensis]|uniref:Phasin domain-containing protein n=1 Tax=Halomonas urumqiensis TaxID=1684789 RepID=A0A2N7UPR4_9GAMM|nr:hypothetical protein [Halomonas urumqiensis]PMR82434.1 hypothetical protein C1H70_01565 [Halomonas urumqiensis]PTB04085.1 hypothetical protein C6V82_06435 [Halomonas urumqiensis]GHE19651.1 hypothetical protein GCM10017767_01720 [Halomonas urumqiensis]
MTTPITNPMFDWWQEQWLKGPNPVARMQLAWLESMADAMQFEAQFIKALAESSARMSECFEGDAPRTHAELQACYQSLVKDITDAHVKRVDFANQLTKEFRQRIWEEL